MAASQIALRDFSEEVREEPGLQKFCHRNQVVRTSEDCELPGGLEVRIPGFHCHGGLGSIPGQGTEILQDVQRDQKKKKKKKDYC